MKKTFIDTNIIVYANDSRSKKKQSKAIEVITKLIKNQQGVISTQVIQEYANVALLKLNQSQEVVIRQISLLESLEVVTITPWVIKRGIEIKTAYKLGFWDSIIISSAEFAKCDTIYSEDFNTGQYYSGIIAVNPLSEIR